MWTLDHVSWVGASDMDNRRASPSYEVEFDACDPLRSVLEWSGRGPARVLRRRCRSEGVDRSPYEDVTRELNRSADSHYRYQRTLPNKSYFTLNGAQEARCDRFHYECSYAAVENGDYSMSHDQQKHHSYQATKSKLHRSSPTRPLLVTPISNSKLDEIRLPKVEELLERVDHEMMEVSVVKQPLKPILNNPLSKSPPQGILKKPKSRLYQDPKCNTEGRRRQRASSESDNLYCSFHIGSPIPGYDSRLSYLSSNMKRAKDNSGTGYSYGTTVAALGTGSRAKSPPSYQKALRCSCKDQIIVAPKDDMYSMHILRTTAINNDTVDHIPTVEMSRQDTPTPTCPAVSPSLPVSSVTAIPVKKSLKTVKKKAKPKVTKMKSSLKVDSGVVDEVDVANSRSPSPDTFTDPEWPMETDTVVSEVEKFDKQSPSPVTREEAIEYNSVAKLSNKLNGTVVSPKKKDLPLTLPESVSNCLRPSLFPEDSGLDWYMGQTYEITHVQSDKGRTEDEPFPGTFQIGRKDRLWRNLQKLASKYGVSEFGIMPKTYVLPHDLKMLKHDWEKHAANNERWIIKPPASARGTGIKVVSRWTQIPKKRPVVVQRYVTKPYLINGNKFDMRLYVLVTSVHPLRIYLYKDGLARFASVKYNEELASLNDRYMHLTNYSINRLSKNYTPNEDFAACEGHKWTLRTLFHYLKTDRSVDTDALWDSLKDLVIKTIISGEASISSLTKANITSRYNCYELFGIDVLLDEDLKPWLLEVNISPSLHSASPLDIHVKGPLVSTVLNIVQFQVPPKTNLDMLSKEKPSKLTGLPYDSRLYTVYLSKEERDKHIIYTNMEDRDLYLRDILSTLTPDDVRHLIQAEDELTQTGDMERVFPTSETHKYLGFLAGPRYYNRLFDAWEERYSTNREPGIDLLRKLCGIGYHLEAPAVPLQNDVDAPTPPQEETASLHSGSFARIGNCGCASPPRNCGGSSPPGTSGVLRSPGAAGLHRPAGALRSPGTSRMPGTLAGRSSPQGRGPAETPSAARARDSPSSSRGRSPRLDLNRNHKCTPGSNS